MSVWVSASKRAAALNEIARLRTRPSTSGSATFMAMSRAARPYVPSRHAASLPPENTTWSTGQSAPTKGVSVAAAPGVETANPVALRITAAGAPASVSPRKPAETGSLRLVT